MDLHGFSPLRKNAVDDTVGSELFVTMASDGPGPDVGRSDLLWRAAAEDCVVDSPRFAIG